MFNCQRILPTSYKKEYPKDLIDKFVDEFFRRINYFRLYVSKTYYKAHLYVSLQRELENYFNIVKELLNGMLPKKIKMKFTKTDKNYMCLMTS